MYGAIREYRLQPGTTDEIIGKIRDEFAPIVTNVRGLVMYAVAVVGGDKIVTTSIFENRSGAEESVKRAAHWVNRTLPASLVGPPRVTVGEIAVREVNEDVKAGYGVMRRFSCTSENAVRIAARVREGLVPIFGATPGFASFALLIESGRDRGGASLSAFADRAAAEAGNRQALAWVKENVGELLTQPPEVLLGEIRLRYATSTVGTG
jgi:hypothetical protein